MSIPHGYSTRAKKLISCLANNVDDSPYMIIIVKMAFLWGYASVWAVHLCRISSLSWSSVVTCCHRCKSTLAQIMVYCLTAPSHLLNQCWHLIIEVLWHSLDNNFIVGALVTILYSDCEYHISNILVISHKGQWINIFYRWDIHSHPTLECDGKVYHPAVTNYSPVNKNRILYWLPWIDQNREW